MLRLPACRETRQLLVVSLAVTGFVLLVLLGGRARPQGTVFIFRHLLYYQDFHTGFVYAAVLCAALFEPVQRAGLRLAAWCGRHPRLLAGVVAAVLAAGSRFIYHAYPLSMDEYAPLFQSKVFLEGELSGRFPAQLIDWLVPGSLQGTFFKIDYGTGALSSVYWPGFALLLTPFALAGVPWLLNPLIGGATLLVMHRLGRELLGSDESAGLAALFTLASPAVTINAISYYSMPAHLLANGLFALLLVRPCAPRAFAAGLLGSLALVLHNPVPHLLFALPWVAWLALRADWYKLLPALAIGYLPLCIVLGFGWSMYLATLGSSAALADLASAAGTTQTTAQALSGVLTIPGAAVIETRLLGTAKLWLWAVPALLVAAAMGLWRLREDRGLWLVLAGSATLTYLGYFFVPWDQGYGWGYRYFHSAWLVLPLFAAAAMRQGRDGSEGGRGYLAGCALLGAVVLTVFQAFQVERFITRHIAQLPGAGQEEAEVIIVDISKGFYTLDPVRDLVQNDPFLRTRPIILASRGSEADAAMIGKHFAGLVMIGSSARGSVWARPAQERPLLRP